MAAATMGRCDDLKLKTLSGEKTEKVIGRG